MTATHAGLRRAPRRPRGTVVASLLAVSVLVAGGAAWAAPQPDATWGQGASHFTIATGSPGDTGLLERLASEFAAQNDARLSWYRAGSGQALDLLRQRRVDMVLAHAPAAEEQAVREGWATGRALIGSNEFWIVGPADDPANIAAATSATDALRRIHAKGARFVSRGDASGTHQREMELWDGAGLVPGGGWYLVTHDFMKASLQRADAERAYFLTDSSTFIVERRGLPHLEVLYRGGKELSNPYHTLYPTEPTPGRAMARRFGEFILSERGQALMRKYGRGRHGEPLYVDAAATPQ